MIEKIDACYLTFVDCIKNLRISIENYNKIGYRLIDIQGFAVVGSKIYGTFIFSNSTNDSPCSVRIVSFHQMDNVDFHKISNFCDSIMNSLGFEFKHDTCCCRTENWTTEYVHQYNYTNNCMSDPLEVLTKYTDKNNSVKNTNKKSKWFNIPFIHNDDIPFETRSFIVILATLFIFTCCVGIFSLFNIKTDEHRQTISQQYDSLMATTNEVFSTVDYRKTIDDYTNRIECLKIQLKQKSDECNRLRQDATNRIPYWIKHNIDARINYLKKRNTKYVLTVSMPLDGGSESIGDDTEWHDYIINRIAWDRNAVELKTNDGHVFIGRDGNQWLKKIR